MTIDNADSFDLHRWYVGGSRNPTFRVTWENAVGDDDDNYDEQVRDFDRLAKALEFGRSLLQAVVQA